LQCARVERERERETEHSPEPPPSSPPLSTLSLSSYLSDLHFHLASTIPLRWFRSDETGTLSSSLSLSPSLSHSVFPADLLDIEPLLHTARIRVIEREREREREAEGEEERERERKRESGLVLPTYAEMESAEAISTSKRLSALALLPTAPDSLYSPLTMATTISPLSLSLSLSPSLSPSLSASPSLSLSLSLSLPPGGTDDE
jgi:hypothetical protein